MSEDPLRHHQIKAEVLVDLQRDLHRVLKEHKDEIVTSIDKAEAARREEHKDHEMRMRALEEDWTTVRATISTLKWVVATGLTVLGLIVAALAFFVAKP